MASRIAAALVALATLAPGCADSGTPTGARRSTFGAVGASLTRFAIEGYNSIGGTRGWPDEELVEYGGAGIATWAAQIGQPGGRTWSIFESVLASEPGTREIWWHILVSFRPGPAPSELSPADQQLVLDVAAEIRRLAGPEMPIYASPIPEFGSGVDCPEVGEANLRISELMVDFAIARGLAEPGPALRPITTENYNGPGDPCHQGPLGREQHGRDLRAFFGG